MPLKKRKMKCFMFRERKEGNWKDRTIKEEGNGNDRSSYAFIVFGRNFQCA